MVNIKTEICPEGANLKITGINLYSGCLLLIGIRGEVARREGAVHPLNGTAHFNVTWHKNIIAHQRYLFHLNC